MKAWLVAFLIFPMGTLPVVAQALQEAQRSHIEGNVPAEESFREFLERDLLRDARQRKFPDAERVEFELLRKTATQSGVALPKFYLWMKIFSGGDQLLEEGAARVAAIEKVEFDVTVFLSKADIQADPSRVGRSFPAALVPEILSRAGL